MGVRENDVVLTFPCNKTRPFSVGIKTAGGARHFASLVLSTSAVGVQRPRGCGGFGELFVNKSLFCQCAEIDRTCHFFISFKQRGSETCARQVVSLSGPETRW